MKSKDLLADSPIIAAVKDMEGLHRSFTSECNIIFILFGNICNISEIVEKIKEQGRYAFVHVDLIHGLGSKEIAVDFMKETTRADGVISTKPQLVKRGMELGLYAVQRMFIIDSMALETTKKHLDQCPPDFIELMPGVIPKILSEMSEYTNVPIISGGLISDKKDVMMALSSGADAISTTKQELWFV